MTDKQIINGIKYEKLTQDQLHDLSQWELVDIILAYRKDLKAKKKECKRLEEELYYWVNGEYCDNKCNVVKELDLLKAELTRANCQIADDEILQCDMRETIEELKAENDNLKALIWWIHVGAEGADKATTEYYENRNTPYEENYWKRIRALQPPTYESKYKLALTEIKEIARVNSINTCWTAINLCADCDEIKECGLQSPFEKLKAIIQIISEVVDEG